MFLEETEVEFDLGHLSDERKLYMKEMVARFGHLLGLQWNLGEESNRDKQNTIDIAAYLRGLDGYRHPVAIHTNYNYEERYNDFYGNINFNSSSFQGDGSNYDDVAKEIREKSKDKGRPWIAYGDEQGPDNLMDTDGMIEIYLNNIFAGGAGCEFYDGNPETGGGGDLTLENFRNYDALWKSLSNIVRFISDNIDPRFMTPSFIDNRGALIGDKDTFINLNKVYDVKFETNKALPYYVVFLDPKTGNTSLSEGPAFIGPGTFDLVSPFGLNSIVLVTTSFSNDGVIIGTNIPYRTFDDSSFNIEIEVKNTGGIKAWSGDDYSVAVLEDTCDVLPDRLGGLNGATVYAGDTFVFKQSMDTPDGFIWCSAKLKMVKENSEFFGNEKDIFFNIGPVMEVDFANNRSGWYSGALDNADTAHGSSGICMYVEEQGENISGWFSSEGYIQLKDKIVYHAYVETSTDQTSIDSIPLFNFIYDNFYSFGKGSIYGGEAWVLDVGGGANGIGRPEGRDLFEFYFAPNAILTPQWRGLANDGTLGALDPSYDTFNDMRLSLRVLDLSSGKLNADIDSGNICIKTLNIGTTNIDDMQFETLYDDPISNSTHFPATFDQSPFYANINDIVNTANYVLGNYSDRATLITAIDPFEVIDIYPVIWESNTLYTAHTNIQLGENSGYDPLDYIGINFDVPTTEIGQAHFTTRGSVDNMLYSASPKTASLIGDAQEYVGFFYSQNKTIIIYPNNDRIRGMVDLFNVPDLFGSGTGSSLLQINDLKIKKLAQ